MEIPKTKEFARRVFSITNESAFRQIALEVYHFQYYNNPVYRLFCDTIDRTPAQVVALQQVPFLPISFFKTHEIRCFDAAPEAIFRSSGTTGMEQSRHLVKDLELYRESFTRCFERFYGKVQNYCVLGLLPSYLERVDSSLVYMVQQLIRSSGHPDSGFYLYDHQQLASVLRRLENKGQKTLLIGVTFALLDFARAFPMKLSHTTIMETGGMKGRGKELVREEVHQMLANAFQTGIIHSEYGMTEMLSQAYANGAGRYSTPPWLKVFVRDETDPLSCIDAQQKTISGALNVVDLANLYSCSFIATEDLARLYSDGSFEILGRMDNTDVRGCSLMTV